MLAQRRLASLVAGLSCAIALAAVARAQRGYHNDAMKVRAFDPPVGWEAQPTGTYTRLLALWADKDGAKLTLVAARVPSGATSRSLADESRPALLRQGFKSIQESSDTAPGSSVARVRLDALLDDGRKVARQLYVVNEGIGYVVTLIGPALRAPQLRRDFDEAVLTLEVGSEPRPPDGGVDVNR